MSHHVADDLAFDPFAGPAIIARVESTDPQREIWTAAQGGRESSLAFNEAVTITLRGRLDAGALSAAIDALVARHESLRATFSEDGREMFVCAPAHVECPRHEWSALGESDRVRMERHLRALVDEPFDLVRGPLVRFALVQLAADHHVLSVCAHHIVCDGWSFGVIAGDLATLYNDALRGAEDSPAPADDFTVYAHDVRQSAASDEAAAAKTFWTARYAADIPVLELPTDRPRPTVRQVEAAREDVVLPAALVDRLRALGAQEGSTLFVTMLAGFAALLHRLTHHDEVVIGIPAAGQSLWDRPALVGHCVNLLPLRVRTPAAQPFREFLTDVRGVTFDALDHQGLTYGALLSLLPIERDPSRLPLANVAFNLDKGISAEAMPFVGLHAELRSVPRTHENFELFLNVVELDGVVTCELQYNTSLFDRETVRRWMGSYRRLLECAASDAARGLGHLDVLTDGERAQLAQWNATQVAVDERALGHHAFERAARAHPESIALEFEGESMTYSALDARANQLARLLSERGVGRGRLVGLCVRRGPGMVVGILGILKAGGTYVPLDPDLPTERLAFTIADAELALLVTEASLVAQLGATLPPILTLDADAGLLDQQPDAALPPRPTDALPESAAYVIYTSGSSGVPKGCLCTHRGLANFVVTGETLPGLQSGDVCIALATLSFDASIIEIFLPLAVGARLVIASREVATDGVRLAQLLSSSGVTFLFATPATFRLLLAAGWRGGRHLTIGCGAEALPRDLAESLLERAATVWNAYGPTEATVWGSAQKLPRPLDRITIGRPLPNVRYHVLDAQGGRVPVGVPGELYIAGRGVAAGYLRRPELTAQRFLPDPDAPDGASLMYRTGDVVRWLPNGEVEYLGRNDDQVKLRGYRIELGEIENRTAEHPAVGGCAVLLREDHPGDRRLVAYVAAAGSASLPTDAELRAHLRATLPDYMVPPLFVRLERLPLTSSGKVNRKALPAPVTNDGARDGEFVEPRTEAEKLVAALWSDALRVGRLGVDDDFFQLGGHSLMASKVLAQLRRDHGVELPYRKIFEAPTLAQFALLVERALADGVAAPTVAIPHHDGDEAAPLSVSQHRLWMLEELNPAQHVVHSHGGAWRFVGTIDEGAVEGAVLDFMRRHPLMRTRFTTVDGAPVQVVEPETTLELARRDLSAVPAESRDEALQAFFEEQERIPFDPSRAPLLRATLIRFDDGHHVLHTLRHALVWDGWSFDVFLSDFCELYSARVERRAPVLPALPITYADFARWQRDWIRSPEMERQVAWWSEHLAGELPVLELPTDYPRPAQSSYAGGRVYLTFPPEEVEQLQRAARATGSTTFQFLFAGFNTLLHRHSGQRELLVGTPVRARARAETSHVVGPFVNTIALRVRVTPDTPFSALLRQVRDVSLDAFGHQDMPFELLGNRVPVVRALFSMQDARTRPTSLPGAELRQVHIPEQTATNDLMLWTMDTQAGLIAVLNYSADLFARDSAEAMLAQFRSLLLAAAADAEQHVGDLPLDAGPAREPEASTPLAAAPATVAEQVRRHVAASPTAPAVWSRGRVTDYATVWNAATGVAAYLQQCGAAGGAVVAVAAEPGVDLVASVLGVWRAGAAALVLDPRDAREYAERLVTQSGAVAIVTDDELRDWLEVARPTTSVREAAAGATDGAGARSVESPLALDPDAVALVQTVVTDSGVRFLELDHGALSHALAGAAALLPGGGVSASLLPITSGVVVQDLVRPLADGGCVAFPPEDADVDGELLADFLHSAGVTTLTAAAESWSELQRASWPGEPALTAAAAGGLPRELWAWLAERSARVVAVHGDPAYAGWVFAGERPPVLGERVLGRVIAGATVAVTDDAGRASATGVPGRLTVGRAPRGTTGHPAPNDDAAPVVRRRADGTIQLVRRAPHTLELPSGRVLLSAIERRLRGHPAVEDACVAGRDDSTGATRVVAYVLRRRGPLDFTDSELRQLVRECLPHSHVPQLFLEVEEIPRSASGEPARDRLPSPYETAAGAQEFVAPRTEEEQLLAALWTEYLDVARVSVHDNFFALGGYSLLCFQLVRRLEQQTRKRISPRVLLFGTLELVARELADTVAGATQHAGAPSSESLLRRLKGKQPA